MQPDASDLDASELRAVRRLTRLFRIERAGRFERRPPMVVRQMIKRRDTVIDQLIAVEKRRRRAVPEPSAGLVQALTELAQEVQLSSRPAAARLQRLDAELRQRTGIMRSGLRRGAGGRLLGSG